MNNVDPYFISTLTGNAPQVDDGEHAKAIDLVVAERFKAIRCLFKQRSPEWHDYDGSRTCPENLGWRFRQYMRTKMNVADGDIDLSKFGNGEYDREIEATWHEAAGAEYWYHNEKEWT